MNIRFYNPSLTKQRGHLKHLGMMAICCCLPILLLLGIGAYGISSESLEFMILLICPIGMGLMVWMMMRGNKSQTEAAAKSESAENNEEPRKITTIS